MKRKKMKNQYLKIKIYLNNLKKMQKLKDKLQLKILEKYINNLKNKKNNKISNKEMKHYMEHMDLVQKQVTINQLLF